MALNGVFELDVQTVNARVYCTMNDGVSSRFQQRDQITHVKITNNHTIQLAATANKMAEKVGLAKIIFVKFFWSK